MLLSALVLLILTALIGSYFYYRHQLPFSVISLCGLFCIGLTLFLYLGIGSPEQFKLRNQIPQTSTSSDNPFIHEAQETQTDISSYIIAKQEVVKKDTQNGEAWYALGDAYMYANEYENADIAFSYAQRLASAPQANILAARASAQYYINHQRITPDVQNLLNQALKVDPENTASLMLLASNHFLSAEYQRAIAKWQQVLDSSKSNLDRVSLIQNIHQAQDLCQCKS